MVIWRFGKVPGFQSFRKLTVNKIKSISVSLYSKLSPRNKHLSHFPERLQNFSPDLKLHDKLYKSLTRQLMFYWITTRLWWIFRWVSKRRKCRFSPLAWYETSQTKNGHFMPVAVWYPSLVSEWPTWSERECRFHKHLCNAFHSPSDLQIAHAAGTHWDLLV